MKIAILGLGQMGGTLGKRWKDLGHAVGGTVRRLPRADELSKALGFNVHTDNPTAVKGADIILLAVKPYQALDVLNEIKADLDKGSVLISICAGLSLMEIQATLERKDISVLRAMPNTPARIGEGMTVIAAPKDISEAAVKKGMALFDTVGRTAVLEEKFMDAATGLSGCGPAYVYLIIEALSEAGVKLGIPRETSVIMAAQTLAGAAKMVLKENVHPATLRDEVTTPAGCTVDGLMALEEGKLRVTLIKGVLAAARKSKKLREPT